MLGSKAHDEIVAGLHRETNRAGGIEAGVSNGEEIVVRAAMKPLPTLMKPLASVDLETGEAAEALVERSDTAAVEALAVVAEAAVAFELARAAREKFGGDALGDFVAAWRAYVERIDWTRRPEAGPSASAGSWAPASRRSARPSPSDSGGPTSSWTRRSKRGRAARSRSCSRGRERRRSASWRPASRSRRWRMRGRESSRSAAVPSRARPYE